MSSCDRRRRFAFSSAIVLLYLALFIGSAIAQPKTPTREVFAPALGKGAIVVVVSGASGTSPYRDFSLKLAQLGYYTVLMDGNEVTHPNPQTGVANLRGVIADSQSDPRAVPGKVALVGFSKGGAGVLLHGASMKDEVLAVVAYYPAITVFVPDISALAQRLQTPVLLLAGEQDHYSGCCLIESMRTLASAPKAVPFELVVYPNADHGFNLIDPRFTYRAEDASDAWSRTIAFLARVHPARVL